MANALGAIHLRTTHGFVQHPIRADQNDTWSDVLDRIPRLDHGVRTLLLQRLATVPGVQPGRPAGDSTPEDVQQYLGDIMRAFPVSSGRGGRLFEREVCVTTDGGLSGFSSEDRRHLATPQNAIGQIPSARKGGGMLVATGPNLTWDRTWQRRQAKARLDRMLAEHGEDSWQADTAKQEMEQTMQRHKRGELDWHDCGLYIIQNKAFVFDPSAITFSADSTPGSQVEERLLEIQAGRENAHDEPGINGRGLVNVSLALTTIRTGFNNNNGRLGRSSNLHGAWIGGGGNYVEGEASDEQLATSTGACRSMAVSWLALVHALRWAWEQPEPASSAHAWPMLDDEQNQNAFEALDFCLGGRLSGGASGPAVDWIRLNVA